MKLFKTISLVLMLSVITKHALSETDFYERLESLQTLSGEFSQTITDADGDEVADPTKGKFSLKRPGLFYWYTSPPYEQKVIGNESGLVVYDMDLEQATIYSAEQFLNSPAAVLSGDAASIKEKYQIEESSRKKKQHYILRERDTENKTFERLVFVFEKNQLKSLSLEDQLGQITAIEFSALKRNKALDESVFHFVPPEGTDVIVN